MRTRASSFLCRLILSDVRPAIARRTARFSLALTRRMKTSIPFEWPIAVACQCLNSRCNGIGGAAGWCSGCCTTDNTCCFFTPPIDKEGRRQPSGLMSSRCGPSPGKSSVGAACRRLGGSRLLPPRLSHLGKTVAWLDRITPCRLGWTGRFELDRGNGFGCGPESENQSSRPIRMGPAQLAIT
jgi:hypothetical protein